jgi:hypothetical protein
MDGGCYAELRFRFNDARLGCLNSNTQSRSPARLSLTRDSNIEPGDGPAAAVDASMR